jgi:hypothetical protein
MPRTKKSDELLKDQEKLIATLKFTPRTYKISIWGYGGETAMGTVDRKIYDYFKHRRLDLESFAWDYDYAEENNIPEDMWPFPPGSWYDCDNITHTNGCERGSGTLQIVDENDKTVFQRSLEDCDGGDDGPGWEIGEEIYISEQSPGTVVFVGNSNEKGTFFEGDIELIAPFDITKLTLHYDDIDGSEIVNGATYDDMDIDNEGYDTTGKSSDFSFYIAGSQKNGRWEKYRNANDCTYEMTDWFPKKVDPVREGIYEIQGGDKKKWPFDETTTARWTGTRWIHVWGDDTPEAEEVKIKQWRGIAHDPDAV